MLRYPRCYPTLPPTLLPGYVRALSGYLDSRMTSSEVHNSNFSRCVFVFVFSTQGCNIAYGDIKSKPPCTRAISLSTVLSADLTWWQFVCPPIERASVSKPLVACVKACRRQLVRCVSPCRLVQSVLCAQNGIRRTPYSRTSVRRASVRLPLLPAA